MSKELVELSELYTQIVVSESEEQDVKKEKELKKKLEIIQSKKDKEEDGDKKDDLGGKGTKTIYNKDGSKETVTVDGSDSSFGGVKKSSERGKELLNNPDPGSDDTGVDISPEKKQENKDKAFDKAFEKQNQSVEKDNPNYGENGKFEKSNKVRAKEISPAKFETNQKQSRELVKSNSKDPYPKIEKDDLNQFSRSKKYTADDGKTQVQRSTVFTKHYKTGKPLGVMTRRQRKAYDLAAAQFKANGNKESSSDSVVSSTSTKKATFKDNKNKPTFQRRDQKLIDKGLKPPKYEKDAPTYTTKLGAFLNNAKVGDLKKKNSTVKVNPEIKEGSFDAYDAVLDYLVGTDQVQSIEEANYVMLEMDGKTINEIKALSEGMPSYVRDSIGRQYGTGAYKGQKYTIEDKKNVINWYAGNIPRV